MSAPSDQLPKSLDAWEQEVKNRKAARQGFAGSFGARACRKLRVRLFAHGRDSLPPSFAASGWIIARIRATVPWADFVEIRKMYVEADRQSFLTGVKHNVDHVIPLQHPRVSGLHVHFNMQVIPAKQNMSKSNEWCPEQLELF